MPPPDGRIPQRGLGKAEAGILGSDADVAGKDQLEPAGDAGAANGGDERNREEPRLEQRPVDQRVDVGAAVEMGAEIGAGAEIVALAPEQHHVEGGIGRQGAAINPPGLEDGTVEGVDAAGIAQRHADNAGLDNFNGDGHGDLARTGLKLGPIFAPSPAPAQVNSEPWFTVHSGQRGGPRQIRLIEPLLGIVVSAV